MLPDLTILLALVIGLMALTEGPVDPVLALVGTAASVCVAVALTWTSGERGVRAVEAARSPEVFTAVRWVGLWPLIGWVAALFFFDWGTFVAVTVPRTSWLVRYIVLFLPAAVLFPMAWVQRGRIEAAIAATRGALLPTGGRSHALRQGLKRNGIALLPLGVIIGLLEGIWLLGEWNVPGLRPLARWLEAMPLLTLGLMFGVLALLSLFLPAIFRRVLSTTPLPPGRIRSLLEAQASALGLRYRDIGVWNTTGRVLNAMVVGFTPRTRLIFLTDALLERLSEEEILAVFSHEAGHARRHHLPLFLVMFVASAVLFHVAGDILEAWVDPYVITTLQLLFLWFVLLGSVSRLFEREADVYGAEHAAALFPAEEETPVAPDRNGGFPAGTAYMIRSLEHIQHLSGRGSSHRHGSVNERVRFLAAYAMLPAVRARFRVVRRRLALAIAGTVLLAVFVLAWQIPLEANRARAILALDDARVAYEEATRLRSEGREEEAKAQWRLAYDGFAHAANRVETRKDARSKTLGLIARFNAADSAFHGLEDEQLGKRDFEAMLALADVSDLPSEVTRPLTFHAHVDLGRILAHEHDPEAFNHWPKARAALPEGTSSEEAWYRARLQLLRGVLLARVATGLRIGAFFDPLGVLEPAVRARLGNVARSSRRVLEDLARRHERGVEWDELRRDARAEIGRLPRP